MRKLLTRPLPQLFYSTDRRNWFRWRPPEAFRRVYPALALIAILGIDALTAWRRWPIPALGMLDDTAHLLTAALLLAAIGLRRTGRMLPWALLGSVLIDLDHVPLYTFAPDFVVGGRPPTHSLVTPVLLILAAVVPRRPWVPGGLALGVCLHFVRDIATGPGVAMFWPVSSTGMRVDYAWYLGIALAAAAGATWRLASSADRRQPRARPPDGRPAGTRRSDIDRNR